MIAYSQTRETFHWKSLLPCLLALAGFSWLVFDGHHYWHEARFLYAVENFSMEDLLAGKFNPHQIGGEIDFSSAGGFYATKCLHLLLLKSLFYSVAPGNGGFVIATVVSFLAVLSVVVITANLFRNIDRSQFNWGVLVGCMLLTPLVAYLAGKLLSEVTALFFAAASIYVFLLGIQQSGFKRLLALLSAASLIAFTAFARLDMVLCFVAFAVAAGVFNPLPVGRRAVISASMLTLVGSGAMMLVIALLLPINLATVVRYFEAYVDLTPKSQLMSAFGFLSFGGLIYIPALFGMFSRSQYSRFIICWYLMTVIPMLLISSNYMVEPRYLTVSLIPFVGLAALGFSKIKHAVWPTGRTAWKGLMITVVGLCNLGLLSLMPYELDRRALLHAAEEIYLQDEDAVILLPWAYTDYHFLQVMKPDRQIYTVNAPDGDINSLSVGWRRQIESWYGKRFLADPVALKDLVANKSVFYVGWKHYPPIEKVLSLGALLGVDLADRLSFMNHQEQSWVWEDPQFHLEHTNTHGQYFVYAVSTKPAPPIKKAVIRLEIPAKDEDIGGLIVADLDGDNLRDVIVTRPGIIAAYELSGEKLWTKEVDIQVTGQSEDNGLPGWQGPGVQVADVNRDGCADVLFLTKCGQLYLLKGIDGQLLRRVSLKCPAKSERWEHLVVSNFRGNGDRDLLLQTTNRSGYRMGRFLAAYGLDDLLERGAKAKPLWTRNDFLACAHSGARIADLDGDGRDEVLGGTIVGPEGEILIRIPLKGHIDALHVDDVLPDVPGLEVVALEEGGGNRVFLYNQRRVIWNVHHEHREPQNAAIGDFDTKRPGLEIWCRSRFETHQRPFVIDAGGKLLSDYEMDAVAPRSWTKKGVEVISTVHWTGGVKQLAAAKERHESGDVGIFDPLTGEFVCRIQEKADRIYVADVIGDWREELIVLSGSDVHIYQNGRANARPDRKRLWDSQAYQRSKMTWNYYNP